MTHTDKPNTTKKQVPVVPSISLVPKPKRSRRHSLVHTKDYFSRSVKSIAESVGLSEKESSPQISRSRSSGEDIAFSALSLSPRDSTASPEVIKKVDNFFASYYQKHPISRLDEVQLEENPNLEL
eukprot:CAMPEP_0117041416 /NCGR_PEP_ID=MMETSP0472-20121206/28924_1 /TAXON_ID=693140 ORGANISM="Tiarina fusus, Strain LIS" /NCGR_SAMPLE_ID=MMETSP0472 /ASSEMBLY_ACC=CAM_ASM_000603 /LENGTH=124 /DNA_ID=CAMNT_0004752419 /DNA_START=14 /DNA_END=388 /DNA_ORIENTATION=-